MAKGMPLHGRDHRPGGADPVFIRWTTDGVTFAYANVIQWGAKLTVTDEGDNVISVKVTTT